MTQQEKDNIIAALRMLRLEILTDRLSPDVSEIATSNGEDIMTPFEIDALCAKLSDTSPRKQQE